MNVGAVWQRVQGWWSALSPNRRLALLSGVGLLIVALVVVLVTTTRTPYTTIYRGLSAADAGAIVDQLETMKEPYRVSGDSIAVPSKDADKIRVQLAAQGLPKNGRISYDSVFSGNTFGMTDQEFNLKTLDALQQNLATTIGQMDGVQSAVVQIVQPQQSVFATSPQQQGKASVLVSTYPGQPLSQSAVYGIQQLVSHAVPGLSARDVAVVDQSGTVLSQSTDAGAPVAAASDKLTLEQSFSKTLSDQLQHMLDPLLGAGHYRLDVQASLDTTQTQSQQTQTVPVQDPNGRAQPNTIVIGGQNQATIQSPAGSIPENIQIILNGPGATAATGGVAGTNGTAAGAPIAPQNYAATAGGGSGPSLTASIQNAADKVQQTITSQPYTIRGLNVSTVVDTNAVPLTAAQQQALQSLLTNAVSAYGQGFTPRVVVTGLPFQNGAVQPASKPPAMAWWSRLPIWAYAAAAAAVVGLILVLLVVRRRESATAMDATLPPEMPREPEHPPSSQDQLAQLARSDPREFASLLRVWLNDDGSARH
ncbi:MAG: flagellar M-ring protein FliF [Firmicutes bacterium]|nr:flagellar M-ring protein FliF [Bacillota bacterium]